jgi:hypothetical protein
VALRNSIITGNTAPSNAAGGGGVGVSAAAPTLLVTNTVIAQNNGIANGTGTGTNSLIGVVPPANWGGTGNLTGTQGSPLDPQLGPLQNNGGPTLTRAPLAGSPVLNAGSNAGVPTGVIVDQRGPGFDRIFSSTVDIGAIESQPGPFAIPTTLDVSTVGETSYTFTVTYSDPVGSNNGLNVATINNNNALRVTGPGGYNVLATYVSIDNNTNGTPRTATYSITPPGGSWDAADVGTYTVSMEASQVSDLDGNFVTAGAKSTFVALFPQTFVVSNTNDSGTGSLRDATTQANLFSPFDTITLVSALPTITGQLTIVGPGASLVTIQRAAAANFRILD